MGYAEFDDHDQSPDGSADSFDADVEPRHEKERSLWLNRVIVDELTRDPERVLAIARENIARWCAVHAGRPAILKALDHWESIIDSGVTEIVRVLTERSDDAADLRQNSPFAGVLTDEQRHEALEAFRADWDRRGADQRG